MALPLKPVVIDRLLKLSPQNYVTVYCGDPRCARNLAGVELDLPATIAEHGDLPLAGLGDRFRCSLCGHRPAESRIGYSLPEDEARGWA